MLRWGMRLDDILPDLPPANTVARPVGRHRHTKDAGPSKAKGKPKDMTLRPGQGSSGAPNATEGRARGRKKP